MHPPFEILDHTADIGFRAWGGSPEELFSHSACAMESIALDCVQAREDQVYPLAVSGDDWESLIVAWLNEVLYYLDGKRVVFHRFQFERINSREAVARGWGEPRDDRRHPPRLVVKGVTYHQILVENSGGRWTAQVFLDI